MSAKNNGTWLIRIPNFEKNGYQYQENQETPSKTYLRTLVSIQKSGGKKNENGYYEDFLIRILAFGKTAEIINKYVGVGGSCMIEGELSRDDDWTDQQGVTRRGDIFIFVRDVALLPRVKEESGSSGALNFNNAPAGNPFPNAPSVRGSEDRRGGTPFIA